MEIEYEIQYRICITQIDRTAHDMNDMSRCTSTSTSRITNNKKYQIIQVLVRFAILGRTFFFFFSDSLCLSPDPVAQWCVNIASQE